ncbi:Carboxy-terminal domain (CTD) phosphatase [Apophysomyces sp. BC1034]|nr:Carboxy-terminal domain (CTD) phosphatase [Apophysomyces sp. BC1015]KAG0178331.1 Carboxy-terminal domain (CTD) phosphatase [Apophysomyces sp. BC1021]KAG0187105.1 Carboxy-terminal domain (CTD) phosphatase [Apophysomyces sp. BC1034]
MEECTHEVQYKGLCAMCGELLESADEQRANINMSHDTLGLTVSRKEAERIEQENAARLMESRKLSLILDLDQTLVHATWDPTVGEWMNDKNNANHAATKDIRKFTLPGSLLVYYIKLRPWLYEFLDAVSRIFELHIYTMGTRHYAEAVAREIDPEGELFRERILSRDESGSMTQKKLQRLFPCDTSMVVVLDDRSDVWSFSPNLIKIKPYEFFVGIGDINSPFVPKQVPEVPIPKPGSEDKNSSTEPDNAEKEETEEEPEEEELAEQEREQEEMAKEQQQQRPLAQRQSELARQQDQPLLVDDDSELYTMLEILKDVHRQFYDAVDVNTEAEGDGAGSPRSKPDVTDLIPSMKKKILQGVHIVFSGVIPLQQDPQTSWIWQLAESFGAVCSLELTGKITHLIAAKAGTSKVNAARHSGRLIKVVTPAWLLDTTSRWKIQNEERYALPSTPSPPGEGEIENPESTPLDLDDGAFDDEDIGLVENIDWEEADREVEDFINESGTDVWDTESEAVERQVRQQRRSNGRSATTHFLFLSHSPLTELHRKGKRKRELNDNGNSGVDSDDDDDDDDTDHERPRSPLTARRAKSARLGRSQLSKVTTATNSENSSESSANNSGDDNEDSSSLDDFAGLLDEEIE